MAQTRIHLVNSLLEELIYVFEKYTFPPPPAMGGQHYALYASGASETVRIYPIDAPGISLKKDIVVVYDTTDNGPYIDDTTYGGRSSVRAMSLDITVTAKDYLSVLAAGDFLESYFDGKAMTLGERSPHKIHNDETFELMEVSFIGESGVELDDSKNHSETFNFNIIYSKGN